MTHRRIILSSALVFFLALLGQAHAEPPYNLIGIVKGNDFIGAVLDDGKNGQALYRLSEPLPDGSVISRIRNDSITIKQSDGVSYELLITQNAKPNSAQARPAAASQSHTSLGQPYEPPPSRAAPAIRAQEPGQNEQVKKRGKRRILRGK